MRFWTDSEKAHFRRLWASGKAVNEIAELLDKHPSAVKNMRRRLGLPARRTGDLDTKIKVGINRDEHTLLRRKAIRAGQTIPGRIRHLIREDLKTP